MKYTADDILTAIRDLRSAERDDYDRVVISQHNILTKYKGCDVYIDTVPRSLEIAIDVLSKVLKQKKPK